LTVLEPDPSSQHGSGSRGAISIGTDPHGSGSERRTKFLAAYLFIVVSAELDDGAHRPVILHVILADLSAKANLNQSNAKIGNQSFKLYQIHEEIQSAPYY